MKKVIFFLLVIISFKSYSQFKNGTDGLTLTNNNTALQNEALFKKAAFDKGIGITRIDSLYYETVPQQYKNFVWSYKYKFIIRDNKITTNVFTRIDYLNLNSFNNLKVIGGDNHYSKDLYKWLSEVLTEIGGSIN